MILQIVLLSCIVYSFGQPVAPQTLAFRLAYQPVCYYQTMIDSFNATNMNNKLDGSGGPYMLFALCDPPSGPLPFYTVNQLNYHLGLGNLAYEKLPDDGLLDTAFTGNKIRITKYAGVPFVNGQRRLSNTTLQDYYGPTEVVKGSFYRLDSNFITGAYGPVAPPNAKTILQLIQDKTLYPSATIVASMLTSLTTPYTPPSTTSWTFLVPIDSSFDKLPKYQKTILTTSGSAAVTHFFNNHAVNGTRFTGPLLKISKERTGTAQATYDYFSTVSGHNLTMRYAYQAQVFYLENKIMNKTDTIHCADGVIHLINDFIYFDEIAAELPPPTAAQFIEQYSTFSLTLKQSLGFDPNVDLTAVTKHLDLIKQSGVIIPDGVTLFLMWDRSISSIGVTSLSQELVLYLMLEGQVNLANLPHDTLIDTYAAPRSLRINVYDDGATTYINGFAKIVNSDLKLNQVTIHVIDTPFLLSPPCQPDDLLCENEEGWINSTIAEDIKDLTDYALWVGLVEKSGFTLPAPYTLFLMPDKVFSDFGENGPGLLAYLNANSTFLQEYVKKFFLKGTLYPNIAVNADTDVTAEDGSVYKFTTVSGGMSVYINDQFEGEAHIRNDGIFYLITLTNAGDLFPFELPPTPVEPTVSPVAPPLTAPVAVPSTAERMNGIHIWHCLFFVLAALFFM